METIVCLFFAAPALFWITFMLACIIKVIVKGEL